MAKSLNEQIEAIQREDQRLAEAAKRREENLSKIVGPIADKLATAIRVRIEEELKANLGKASDMDLSREGTKAAVDAFWASITGAKKPAAEVKVAKGKAPAADKGQAAPAVAIEG